MLNPASRVRWLLIRRTRVRKLEDRKAAAGCFGYEAKLVGGDPLSFPRQQKVARSQRLQAGVGRRHEDSQFAGMWTTERHAACVRQVIQRNFGVLVVES